MSQISAAAVKELRDRTDMPMMKCKAALEKAGGDIEKAILVLREEGGKFLASDKGARETAEGRIGAYSDHKTAGAILELRCESPSVVKNDRFVALANDLAKQVALKNPATVEDLLRQPLFDDPKRTVQDRVAEVAGRERDLARKQAAEQAAGKPANVVEKIAEGKYKTWLGENVLVDQPMANQMKYGKKTVGELLKAANLEMVKFVRYKVGEKA